MTSSKYIVSLHLVLRHQSSYKKSDKPVATTSPYRFIDKFVRWNKTSNKEESELINLSTCHARRYTQCMFTCNDEDNRQHGLDKQQTACHRSVVMNLSPVYLKNTYWYQLVQYKRNYMNVQYKQFRMSTATVLALYLVTSQLQESDPSISTNVRVIGVLSSLVPWFYLCSVFLN